MTVLSVVEAHQVLDEIERRYATSGTLIEKLKISLGPPVSIVCAAALPTLVREWRATLERHQKADRPGNMCVYCDEYFDPWPCVEVKSVLVCLEPFRGLIKEDA